MNFAKMYDVPLEVIYCYAWRLRKIVLAKELGVGDLKLDYWDNWSLAQMGLQKPSNLPMKILQQVESFLLQADW
jgi:hypothetical protein